MLWYSFNAIQMGTHNIYRDKEADKMYTGCNLKTTELLDCALTGVCAVIRSNTVLVNVIMKRSKGQVNLVGLFKITFIQFQKKSNHRKV